MLGANRLSLGCNVPWNFGEDVERGMKRHRAPFLSQWRGAPEREAA
jgi:hypothetical protein